MSESDTSRLPEAANDNVNPLRYPGTALLELFRWRRRMLEKDKSGYSDDQWRRHYDALKGVDEAIGLLKPYL